jgi:signal transduction histidine kinase
MSIGEYLKDKIINLFVVIVVLMVTSVLMYTININIYYIIFIEMVISIGFLFNFFFDFIKRKIYYDNFRKTFKELEEKSYITEVVKKPNFIDGKILYDSLKMNSNYLNNVIASYNIKFSEYEDYIEAWIHEVKTPIATSKLIIENNKTPITLNIGEEIDKVDDYVEQVLYFAKSDSLEKDYNIRKVSLKQMVMNEFRRKSKAIINGNIRPNFNDLDYYILTDSKWMEFIVGQIITNSIKYKSNNPTINIYAKKENSKVNLYIKDNGIGILEKDIHKVFDKGYIGTNGRNVSKSTGMGLYICKKLCDKMGVGIDIISDVNCGTIVKLMFREAV